MNIDCHQHFWRYTPEEYGWIDGSMASLRRDFLPQDLAPELQAEGVEGTIAVQARTTVDETDWLLELADGCSWIVGVVGWVPLGSPDLESILESRSAHPRLVGVREVLQGRPLGSLSDAALNRGIALLARHGLVYDIVIYQNQLREAVELVDRHPEQTFVLDHLAKPLIRDQLLQPWATEIKKLATRPNIHAKVSGLVTEADHSNWSAEELYPYMNIALEAFGPERLLFGSDWPVCRLAGTYAGWTAAFTAWASQLSTEEQSAILGKNARRVYGLK